MDPLRRVAGVVALLVCAPVALLCVLAACIPGRARELPPRAPRPPRRPAVPVEVVRVALPGSLRAELRAGGRVDPLALAA